MDDAAIQVYKNGDYGTYLDLESSLDEQSEEIEGMNAKWVFLFNFVLRNGIRNWYFYVFHFHSRKNSLVVRTQLSVRVHNIIGE